MPYFVRKLMVDRDEGEYVRTTLEPRSRAQLRQLFETEPSAFFSVPESHARQVMRNNDAYQEVTDEFMESVSSAPPPVPVRRRARKAWTEGDKS